MKLGRSCPGSVAVIIVAVVAHSAVLAAIIDVTASTLIPPEQKSHHHHEPWQGPREYDYTTNNNHADLGGTMAVMAPPSPECWKTAMALFYRQASPQSQSHSHSHSQSSSSAGGYRTAASATRWESAHSLCARMHEDHQKLLALLIAKCHLHDLGRDLLDDPTAWDECWQQAWQHRDALLKCLRQLTDSGVNAYTHYVTYVQQLCTRLTQELVLQSHSLAHQELTDQYERLAGRALERLETLDECAHRAATNAVSQHQRWAKRWHANATSTLQKSLVRTVRMQLGVQLEAQLGILLERESHALTLHAERLVHQANERDEERRREQQAWTDQQGRLWQHQVGEWEHLQSNLRHYQDRLEHLTESVRNATQTVFPMAQVRSVLTAIAASYSWWTLVWRLMSQGVGIWMATRLLRRPQLRSYLVGVVLLETLVIGALTRAMAYHLCSEATMLQITRDVRQGSFYLQCATCLIGSILPLLRNTDPPPVQGAASTQSKDNGLATAQQIELLELRHRHEQVLRHLEALFGRPRNTNTQGHEPTIAHPTHPLGPTHEWSTDPVNDPNLRLSHPQYRSVFLPPSASVAPPGPLQSPMRPLSNPLLPERLPAPRSPPVPWAKTGSDPLVVTRASALVQPSPWMAPKYGATVPAHSSTGLPYPHPLSWILPPHPGSSPPSPQSRPPPPPPSGPTFWREVGSPVAVVGAVVEPNSAFREESRSPASSPPSLGRGRKRGGPSLDDDEVDDEATTTRTKQRRVQDGPSSE